MVRRSQQNVSTVGRGTSQSVRRQRLCLRAGQLVNRAAVHNRAAARNEGTTMDTQGEHVEQDVCSRCGGSGLTHEASCPNRRIRIPLPGAPGPPFSVTQKAALDALGRALDGRSVGDTDEQFVGIVEAVLAQASRGGTRIDIRDCTIVLLNASDIRGVHSISVNVSGLARAGYQEAAEALKKVTEAVTHSAGLTARERTELLELLDELSKQAVLSRTQRAKPGVVKGVLTGLATGLAAAGGLAEVWSTWGPAIQRFFGL
jgi:hypothetical protein